MDLGLAGRVALVTGGSQGIGRSTALLFASEGARVALTYCNQPDLAERVVEEIDRMGGSGFAARLDLFDDDSIDGAAAATLARWGRIDVLVNNAVYWGERDPMRPALFECEPAEEWRRYLRPNFEGAYRAVQAVLPSMRANRWGRIVNISSGIALDGFPGAAPYGAAKAALHGLTKTLAREIGPLGILVNVVAPGLTLTDRMRARLPDEHVAACAQASPLGRVLPPEELAPAIVFLASAANTSVTGELLRFSGGTT